jgi:4-aminobutyrate aminotransferase-like enzyme/Ser/Thr protein kinase RdoA (MazF antagonist)
MSVIRSVGPQFSTLGAIELAHSLYGLTEFVGELPSERDQNFLFRHQDGRFLTLKIANRDEPREVIDLQNRAMEHVGQGLMVMPTVHGEKIATSHGHFVRVVNYVPGVPLAEYRPHSPTLLANLGRLLGQTDKALESFSHPAAQRELYWDVRNAERILDDGPILKTWRETVMPRLGKLRTSVIHNDANDYNVIVKDEETIALIDFGDMLETYTVCEPAIACAYAMLAKPDPIAAAAAILRGYHETHPLTETEIELMYHFIRTRLGMSLAIAGQQKKLEPDNEYLLISEKPVRALLEKLDTMSPQYAHYVFRNACGLTPCPQTPSIEGFLQSGSFGRVVDVDLSSNDVLVLDLSIDSLELGTWDESASVERMTTLLFRRLEDAGARVGIGRYNEPRGVYTSPLFSTESNDGPEWRTIHLGIDLFMPAGTPLYAALDGTVHAFRNNDAALDYGPTIILRHATSEGVEFFTLYGHLSLDSLGGLAVGKQVKRGEQIARIGNYPTNGNWAPHVHFQIIVDMLEREGEFPGVAAPSMRNVWLSLSPDPNLILKIPASKFPQDAPSSEETLSNRRKRIGPNLSISYKKPLKIVRGAGAYLYDDVGRGYLDCVNNVAHVGHCHPRVVHAAQLQMAVLNTNTRYLHDNIVEYARRLTATLPASLSVCFFVNSGSEANDLALRIARAHIRSNRTIVMESAYHGNLTSLIDISPYKFDGPGGAGVPSHVRKVHLADPYRGGYTLTDVQDVVEGPATLILESIVSCGGQVVLPEGYLEAAYRPVRAAGGICIADEVQVGFGRAGTRFWAFETQGVVPDIVTVGKSIGNGHPLGAVVTTPQIAASFDNGMEYFNTFGGNAVSCAVGIAVLDVIEDQQLQTHALRVGNGLRSRLESLQSRHSLIGDVRGLGFFIGIELVRDRERRTPAPEETSYIVERMRDRGILLSIDGPFHNVIKFKPPMVFSESDGDQLISSLDVVLGEFNKTGAIPVKNRV